MRLTASNDVQSNGLSMRKTSPSSKPYDYMAFARRIGELWEPFCKLPFEYPVKTLKIIEPPDFDKVQAGIKKQTKDYISKLDITEEERRMLSYYYGDRKSVV